MVGVIPLGTVSRLKGTSLGDEWTIGRATTNEIDTGGVAEGLSGRRDLLVISEHQESLGACGLIHGGKTHEFTPPQLLQPALATLVNAVPPVSARSNFCVVLPVPWEEVKGGRRKTW